MTTSHETHLIVCNICEIQVHIDTFERHSLACKDVAEIKEQILQLQLKLETLGEEACAIKKQILFKSLKEMKKNKGNQVDTFETNCQLPSKEKQEFSEMKAEFQLENEDGEEHPRRTLRKNTYSPIRDDRPQQNSTIRPRTQSPFDKFKEKEEERRKTFEVLKKIIQYGKALPTGLQENHIDITSDLKIKNEIKFSNCEITDKRISSYLEKFGDLIRKLVQKKKLYFEKQMKIWNNSLRSPRNVNSKHNSSELSNNPNLRSVSAAQPSRIEHVHINKKSPQANPKAENFDYARICLAENKGSDKLVNPVFAQDKPSRVPFLENFDVEKKTLKKPTKKIGVSLLQRNYQIDNSPFRSKKERNLRKSNRVRKSESVERIYEMVLEKKEAERTSPLTSKLIASNTRGEEKQLDMKCVVQFFEDQNIKVRKESRNNPLQKQISLSKNSLKSDNNVTGFIEIDSKVKSDEETRESGTNESLLGHNQLSDSDKQSRPSESQSLNEIEDIKRVDHEFPSVISKGYSTDPETEGVKRKNCVSTQQTLNVNDFDFLKLLGKGAFGRVFLVKKKTTGDIYAMKIVDFEVKEYSKMISSLRAERDVYKLIQGEWVTKAFYSFSYKNYVCFVIEYMSGGDLSEVLEEYGRFDEKNACFYFAELVLAVESLHKVGIVHRDLKPCNVLLDSNGHIKLTDFGLSEKGLTMLRERASIMYPATRSNSPNGSQLQDSDTLNSGPPLTLSKAGSVNSQLQEITLIKQTSVNKSDSERNSSSEEGSFIEKDKKDEKTVFSELKTSNCKENLLMRKLGQTETGKDSKKMYRVVGTPDYMAPEIISGEGYQEKTIDLWSLGVILYEFLVGELPFSDMTRENVYDNILQLKIAWPPIGDDEDSITQRAQELILQLLKKNPNQRLSLKEIKEHKLFKGFDWNGVRRMKAPHIPEKKEIDTESRMSLEEVFPNLKPVGRLGEKEIQTFNTRRCDLLFQKNEESYKQHPFACQSPKKNLNSEGKGSI